jgi:uroporphyrinogen III methyltransferase/synthase
VPGFGKVFLVGAGPGAPDLITLKAKSCLEKADIVIYDYLVNREILKFAPLSAELICVGKRNTSERIPQDRVNSIMIEKAKEGKNVVRLKGGDPFIFGRGGEEAIALAEAGVEFEIVPGVTAAVAVPEYAGIPLTHREFSSVLFLTGHESSLKPQSSIDWKSIARVKGTLVFYMGMKTLPHIIEKLLSSGKPPNTPAAVIHWGSLPVQKSVQSTLKNIVNDVKKNSITSPSILVVGDVVKLRKKINWYEAKPLYGKTILITRAEEQGEELSVLLRDLGANVVNLPMIKIVPPSDYAPMDSAIERLRTYNWLIFTSVNGVKFFFARLKEKKKDLRELNGIKIMAIGPRTREEVEKYNLSVDAMPEKFIAESVVSLFGRDVKGQKILLPRAKVARDIIPEELKKKGAEVDVVSAYETILPELKREKIFELFNERNIDVLVFTSSSTVKNFVHLAGQENLKTLLDGVKIACIGPVTEETAKGFGIKTDILPEEYTMPGITQAIQKYFYCKKI